jgi:hypothetical protein
VSSPFRDPAAWQELVADEALVGLSDEAAAFLRGFL